MYVEIFLWIAATFTLAHADTNLLNIKVAVVTGGARGIGYAIVDNFLKNGAKTVIIVDKNQTGGMMAETELNSKYGANRTVFMYGDVTKDLERVASTIYKTFGYVNVLVNNAGLVNEKEPVLMVNTNALATMLWAQRFYNCMRKDRGGKGGTIINIASISSYTKEPLLYFYKATKFAVLGLTFGMGHEFNYLTTEVRVIAICPGLTDTVLAREAVPLTPEQVDVYKKLLKSAIWQSPDDVGKAAAILYRTGRTGTAYTVENKLPPVVSPDRVETTAEVLLSL